MPQKPINPPTPSRLSTRPAETFRHALFPAYKANRPAARAVELEGQLAIMRSAADVLGLVPMEAPGYEADDLIATLAHRAQTRGIRSTIVSSDKDFGQLVVDGSMIVDPMSRLRRLSSDVVGKFGVPPHLVQDVQALAGDPVDGIPGIPGVGLDKAARLVRRFGSLEGVLENINSIRWPAVRSKMKGGEADARLYLELTTLRRDALPPGDEVDDLRDRPVMRSHILELCRALEAPAWAMAMFSGEPEFIRAVPHVADQFQWWDEELIASGQVLPDDPQSASTAGS